MARTHLDMPVQIHRRNYTIELPGLEYVTATPIRDALQHLADTEAKVQKAQEVARETKAGTDVADMAPDEIAELIRADRERDQLMEEAEQRLDTAIAEHYESWRADVDRRLAKASAACRKASTAARTALDEYEVYSGLSRMLHRAPGVLRWQPDLSQSQRIKGVENGLDTLDVLAAAGTGEDSGTVAA